MFISCLVLFFEDNLIWNCHLSNIFYLSATNEMVSSSHIILLKFSSQHVPETAPYALGQPQAVRGGAPPRLPGDVTMDRLKSAVEVSPAQEGAWKFNLVCETMHSAKIFLFLNFTNDLHVPIYDHHDSSAPITSNGTARGNIAQCRSCLAIL